MPLNERSHKLKHILVPCTRCGLEVVLSDSSIDTIKERYPEKDLDKDPPSAVCLHCVLSREEFRDSTFVAPGKVQTEQLKQLINERGKS